MTLSELDTGERLLGVRAYGRMTGEMASLHLNDRVYAQILKFSRLPDKSSPALAAITDKLAGTPTLDLLDELNQRFELGWRSISHLLGVSVAALTKWRVGGGLSAERDEALRRLVAFAELVSSDGTRSVEAWLASRPLDYVPFTTRRYLRRWRWLRIVRQRRHSRISGSTS